MQNTSSKDLIYNAFHILCSIKLSKYFSKQGLYVFLDLNVVFICNTCFSQTIDKFFIDQLFYGLRLIIENNHLIHTIGQFYQQALHMIKVFFEIFEYLYFFNFYCIYARSRLANNQINDTMIKATNNLCIHSSSSCQRMHLNHSLSVDLKRFIFQ